VHLGAALDATVAYDLDKLPPEIQSLLDRDRPLPAGTQFFEQQFTYGDVVKQGLLGLILLPGGALVTIVAIVAVFGIDRHSPNFHSMQNFLFGAALVSLLVAAVGFMMLKSLWSLIGIVRTQNRGDATRYGVFLRDDSLILHNEDATKVVPKTAFKGLKGRNVQFEHDGETKTLLLPAALVRTPTDRLDAAVAAWAT
jgi:hypothetical protein